MIVDIRIAGKTNGETGVRVLAGPRIGPGALEEIFCQGRIDLVGIAENGKPWIWDDAPAPWAGNCGVMSSTEMVDAPWKAVPAATGSKSIMSNRGPTEATPISTI